MAKKPGRVDMVEPAPTQEDALKCAKEINDILIKYRCMIIPKTQIVYNRVEQTVDIVPGTLGR
jgi:hypothetical protein